MKPRLRLRLVEVISYILLCCAAVGISGCDSPTQASCLLFHDARALVKDGQFEAGKKGFTDYLRQYPNGSNASRAAFFIAKCELGLGNLHAARAAFTHCRDGYPNSEEADKSRYKLAFIDLLEGNHQAALRELRLMATAPTSTLAPETAALAVYLERSINE